MTVQRVALGFLSLAISIGLLVLLINTLDTGVLNLGWAGIVVKSEAPVSFWALVVEILLVLVLLLMLAAALIANISGLPGLVG
jgi:hypothetical protein